MRILTDCLRYPLRGGAPGVIVALAPLLSLAFYAGPFGWPLAAILLSWGFKYVFICMEDSARGEEVPVVPGIGQLSPLDEQRPLKLLVLIALAGGAVAWLRAGGWSEPATVLALTLAAAAPAMLTILALEDSLFSALNPVKVLATAGQLGWAYLPLALVLILVVIVSVELLTSGLAMPLLVALLWYLMIAAARLIGRLLRARGEELGTDRAEHPVAAVDGPTPAGGTLQPLLSRLYPPSQVGRAREVYPELDRFIRERGGDPALEAEIHQELMQWRNPRLGLLHARDYILRLLDAGRVQKALAVADTAVGRDTGFRLGTAGGQRDLARHAGLAGRSALAVRLLANLREGFPEAPELPDAMLDEARLRSEGLGEIEEGRALLSRWLQAYARHERRSEAEALAALLAEMPGSDPGR